MRQHLSAATLPKPKFRYAAGVQIGSTYQIAGMIALDPVTGALEPGGPEAEARKIFANMVGALPELGLGLEDLVIVRIFITDIAAFPSINTAWEEVFEANGPLPARTTIGIASLPLGASVEIEFTFQKE